MGSAVASESQSRALARGRALETRERYADALALGRTCARRGHRRGPSRPWRRRTDRGSDLPTAASERLHLLVEQAGDPADLGLADAQPEALDELVNASR